MFDSTVPLGLRWRMACWLVLAASTAMGAGSLTLVLLLVAFAPLVLVPFGVPALLGTEAVGPWTFARRVLDAGAACAVIASLLPVGRLAGAAALGWLAATIVAVAAAAWQWWLSRPRLLGDLWPIAALAWLPAAAGWYAASRAGVAPFGFGEPITVLTAAHFHVAGFYATLHDHAETGEERFLVERDDDGRVTWRLTAVSRPGRWYTVARQPIVRLLQARFRRDAAKAMQTAVADALDAGRP